MARVRAVFNNFINGEISPLLAGRTDSPQYRSGSRTMKNLIPDRRGGVFTRPAIIFAGTPKNEAVVRFIPFVVSRDISYLLEVGVGYIRFWRDGALVTDGSVVEVSTSFDADDILDIQYAQANDVMYMVCDGRKPRRLTRTDDTTWAIASPSFNGAPWDANYDGHADGFPRTVCFFNQRLVFGGRISEPQTIWTSRAADFEQFATGATNADDDPLTLVIAAYTQELIQWLAPSRALFIGTTGNEQRILVNGYLAPGNPPDISRQSSYGSRYIQPVFIGTQTVFVQASGKKLRNYDLNLRANVEIYDSIDLTLLSEHIGDLGINQIAYQQIPESILWAVTDDGKLVTMTYDPSLGASGYEGVGWAQHEVDGIVESVQVIPKPTHDEVWVCVNRSGVRYIGYLNDDNYALDASVIEESGSTFTTMSGLDHLEGEEVGVVVDGAVIPNKTVSSGSISLGTGGRFAQAGLLYEQKIETMPIEVGGQDGSSMGRKKWFREIFVRLHDSMPPSINGKVPDNRTPSTPMGNREPFITGDVKVNSLGSGRDGLVTILQELPFFMRILAIHGSVEVGSE